MLIQNYGLFWKRSDVFWGHQGVTGHLKGLKADNLKSDAVDFRNQQGVYVLYDDNFRLLYVGQAGSSDDQRLFVRLRQHKRDPLADRWTKFSWFGIRWVTKKGQLSSEAFGAHTTNGEVLNHIEAILISSAEPPLNRQGGRFGVDVEQYRQFRDANALGLDVADMVRALYKQISD